MYIRFRFLTILLLLFGGVGAAAIGTAGPAAAATPASSCYGGGCDYVQPNGTSCANDATTIDSFVYYGSESELYGALLELRYSPSCYAAWARVTGGDGGCSPYAANDCAAVIEASTNKSTINMYVFTNVNGVQNYTSMLDFNYWTRACLVNITPFSGNYSYVACTAWH